MAADYGQWTTPLAAIGLATVSLMASGFHIREGEWLPTVETALWASLAASIAIGRVYPEFIQQITVKPNEQNLEAPYVSNNLAMTRLAFDIDDWDVRDYRGESPLTEAAA